MKENAHGSTEVTFTSKDAVLLPTDPKTGQPTKSDKPSSTKIKQAPDIDVHTVASDITTVPADCVTANTLSFNCATCGEVVYTLAPANGHDIEVIEGKPATCIEPGLTDGNNAINITDSP